jgi:hypothetical protein
MRNKKEKMPNQPNGFFRLKRRNAEFQSLPKPTRLSCLKYAKNLLWT